MPSQFRPGFRLSPFDALILAAGACGAILEWSKIWWLGFVIAFVVGHFFLFCNVFRISRRPEILWATIFILLTALTVFAGRPTWIETASLSIVVTVVIVGLEMRKPSYHGIGWKFINPKLREWWDANLAESSSR